MLSSPLSLCVATLTWGHFDHLNTFAIEFKTELPGISVKAPAHRTRRGARQTPPLAPTGSGAQQRGCAYVLRAADQQT